MSQPPPPLFKYGREVVRGLNRARREERPTTIEGVTRLVFLLLVQTEQGHRVWVETSFLEPIGIAAIDMHCAATRGILLSD